MNPLHIASTLKACGLWSAADAMRQLHNDHEEALGLLRCVLPFLDGDDELVSKVKTAVGMEEVC